MYSNNNKNKKKKIKTKNQKGGEDGQERERLKKERRNFVFFLFFISLSDLRKSDRRFSLEQKAKLVYAMRATHGYQKLSVSSNSKR